MKRRARRGSFARGKGLGIRFVKLRRRLVPFSCLQYLCLFELVPSLLDFRVINLGWAGAVLFGPFFHSF